MGGRSALLRFVVAEVDGVRAVVLDVRRALPGRGAWLHPDPGCWALAQRRSALARALRTSVQVDHPGLARAAEAAGAMLDSTTMDSTTMDSTRHDSTTYDSTTRRPARDDGTST